MKFRDSIYYAILKDDLALLRGGVLDLGSHFSSSLVFIQSIPADRLGFAYAPGKWTVSQVLGHLSDIQTVFLNRALYISRGQSVALYPIEEQLWVGSAGHAELGREKLLDLYASGAAHVQSVVSSLPPGSLAREGVANEVEITAEEVILYLMAHEMHHLRVIRERYLG
ncbi:MAG: DinB family protein [Fibrobacteria bacterium]